MVETQCVAAQYLAKKSISTTSRGTTDISTPSGPTCENLPLQPNFINNHIISAIQSLMPTFPALPISTFCIQSMPLFVSLIIIIIGWQPYCQYGWQPHRQQGWRPHCQHCLHGLAPELWNQDEQKQETSTNIIVIILWLFSIHLLW